MTAISISLREAAPGLLTRERIIANPALTFYLDHLGGGRSVSTPVVISVGRPL